MTLKAVKVGHWLTYFFYFILVAEFLLSVNSCQDDDTLYIPKPKGYLRITFPEKNYINYTSLCPFTFEYPVYSKILRDELKNADSCWINIDFPSLKGRIHLSYKHVDNNLISYTEDSRTFVVKHQLKASAIDERIIIDEEKKVYGLLYDIRGNTASSIQFYLTDSATHFIRGALYFSAKPNVDSLAPVIDFVGKDIEKLIQTFEWK